MTARRSPTSGAVSSSSRISRRVERSSATPPAARHSSSAGTRTGYATAGSGTRYAPTAAPGGVRPRSWSSSWPVSPIRWAWPRRSSTATRGGSSPASPRPIASWRARSRALDLDSRAWTASTTWAACTASARSSSPAARTSVPRALGAAGLRAAHAGLVPSGSAPARADGRRARRWSRPTTSTRRYYERWLWSAERRLERKGTIAPGEVEAMMERLRGGRGGAAARGRRARRARRRGARRGRTPRRRRRRARFAPGDRVRVRRMRPPGHTRCPRYARGAAGIVEGVHGARRAARPRRLRRAAPSPSPSTRSPSAPTMLWGAGDEAAVHGAARPLGELPGGRA